MTISADPALGTRSRAEGDSCSVAIGPEATAEGGLIARGSRYGSIPGKGMF